MNGSPATTRTCRSRSSSCRRWTLTARRTATTRRRPEDALRADAERPREQRSPSPATTRSAARRRAGPPSSPRALSRPGVPRWTSPASSSSSSAVVRRPHAQPAVVGDAQRGAAARGRAPADLAPGERVARAVGVHRLLRRRREPVLERAPAAARAPTPPAADRAPSEVAIARSSGGKASSSTATLRPIPSTTQPSWGRPSARMPATLRPSSSTSFGHLIALVRPAASKRSATSATASAASIGSSRGGSRSTSEQASARPAGRHPRAPLSPVSGGLRRGRHERPVRRAAHGQPLRPHVRRVDLAEVEAGGAERHGKRGHAADGRRRPGANGAGQRVTFVNTRSSVDCR